MNQESINNRSTITVRAAQKKPFIAKGHDSILKTMQDCGEQVSVVLLSTDVPVVGRLVARDKYTITVLGDTFGRRTFYKHAIESFGFVTTQVQ